MFPFDGAINVSNMRMVVDLPAPFCPRKPYTSPSCTVKERSSTAVKFLNCFVKDVTFIISCIPGLITAKVDKRLYAPVKPFKSVPVLKLYWQSYFYSIPHNNKGRTSLYIFKIHGKCFN